MIDPKELLQDKAEMAAVLIGLITDHQNAEQVQEIWTSWISLRPRPTSGR